MEIDFDYDHDGGEMTVIDAGAEVLLVPELREVELLSRLPDEGLLRLAGAGRVVRV